MNRRGFALLATLWLITVTTSLVLGATMIVRDAIGTAETRIASRRAYWKAEGCLAELLATLERRGILPSTWQAGNNRDDGCVVSLVPAGARLNVNIATEEELLRLLGSDSLAESLLDWRDADTIARPKGAEARWYRDQHRLAPRNGPFAAQAEIHLVRGFEYLADIDSSLDVEAGRVPVTLAPVRVVAVLPGIGPEILGQLVQRRRTGNQVASLDALAQGVSPAARDEFLRRYGELVEVATIAPEAWIAQIRARDPLSQFGATTEVRLVAAAGRIAVVRRRSW